MNEHDLKPQPDTADNYGHFDAGIKSLVKSLQLAFVFLLLIIIGMMGYFFTFGGYFTVKKNQEAVIVLRFGKYLDTFVEGWHWYVPYPMHRFIRIKTNQQSVEVNFTDLKSTTKLRSNLGKPLVPGRDKYLLTGNANIVHSRWVLNYRITQPKRYYLNFLCPDKPTNPDEVFIDDDGYERGTRGPQTLLRNFLRDAIIQVTAGMAVDDVLTHKQTEFKQQVYSLVSQKVAEQNCGLEIVNVDLPLIEPPENTKQAFRDVTNASNAKSQLIDKAREYQVQEENNVMAQKAEILAAAEAYRQEVVAEVKSETTYFKQILKEYRTNPETVLMVLYNNTLSEVLGLVDQKYILNGKTDGKQEVRIKINPEPLKRKLNSTEGQENNG